ncbi:MAG: proline racemase family protein [Ignavibacteria bacterium]|nr:proline racemase family protein [Ignavibacteria bacterium]
MDLSAALAWRPPTGMVTITAIDAHTAGEPLRVILAGFPELKGGSILEKRQSFRTHADSIRTALMWEPRGHADMYGCVIVPPQSPDAAFGVLFLHNEGYSTMCGHGIIAVATVAVETGMVPRTAPETRIVIDTPAGAVTAFVEESGGIVERVRFQNVPSFVVCLDQETTVPEIGRVRYDIAFGGAFYAFVGVEQIGLRLDGHHVSQLREAGRAIKRQLRSVDLHHPGEKKDLEFLYGVIFTGAPVSPGSHSRNVCIFADGEVDRSPTGTGVSARLAIHHARKEIGTGEEIVIESILGTTFTGKVIAESPGDPFPFVDPEVFGRAFITGRHQFFLDPLDPLKDGFLLR